jgi:hypothetical protein
VKLYFARHGESEANVLRVISNRGATHGLTERGRRQSAELASNLKGAGVTRVYSSPLLRALQTAEIVSSALGVAYEVTDALREFDCGIAEGRADPEAWALHRRVMDDWRELSRHSESFCPFHREPREGEGQGRCLDLDRSWGPLSLYAAACTRKHQSCGSAPLAKCCLCFGGKESQRAGLPGVVREADCASSISSVLPKEQAHGSGSEPGWIEADI